MTSEYTTRAGKATQEPQAPQSPVSSARLLPWVSPEGKPAYLIGEEDGFLATIADNVESVQLDMASDLLGHAADILSDRQATPEQLRYVVARMAESLRDLHRIACSRGERIPDPVGLGDPDEPEKQEDEASRA